MTELTNAPFTEPEREELIAAFRRAQVGYAKALALIYGQPELSPFDLVRLLINTRLWMLDPQVAPQFSNPRDEAFMARVKAALDAGYEICEESIAQLKRL